MTEQNAALAFDRALDGERGLSLNGSESLVLTAHAMQTLFDRQQEIPTEEFVMQLEQTLLGLPVVPSIAGRPVPAEGLPAHTVVPTGVEGSPAGAVSLPHPTPRPAPLHPKRTRTFPRWAAIAASLILLFGGAGAIALGPFDLHSTPDPSAIPAIGFGTVEASPEPVGTLWAVDPMPGASIPIRPPVISNGIAFQTSIGSTSPIQAIDLQTGTVLWSGLTRVAPYLATGVDDLLIIAGGNGNSAGFRFELVALHGRTGDEVWSEPLSSEPVGLRVLGDQIIVLGGDNLLESFDLQTHERRWQTDLSRFVDSMGDNDGLNRFTDLDSDRLAVVDGVIGALLSNGRLIAVDASDGRLKWSDTRRSSGWTRLRVVDEKFVVLAFGSGVLGSEPVATPEPFAPFDPSVDPCVQTLRSRPDSTAEVPPILGETVDLFDPDTGTSAWGVVAEESYSIAPTDDGRLIVQIGPGWESSIANNNESFTCAIDGSTGAVSQTTGSDLVTFVVPGSEPGAFVGIGVLPGGVLVGIDSIDPETAASLPYFDSDPAQFSGFRWVQKADGLILITAQDGTLLGFPANSPGKASTEATPTAAMPTTDTGWIAHGPDGITDYAEVGIDHVIADGRIFRAFNMKTGGPHVQAVDATTGDVLWDVEVEFGGDLMVGAGDLLLVAAQNDYLDSRLVALDMATGREVWTATLSDLPVAMVADGNRVLVLGVGDKLDGIDLETGQTMYAVDIRGEAQNVNPYELTKVNSFADYPTHRMAIDDKTLYATLADGSVVAVDPETGSGKWWSLRATPGVTQIYVIAGDLVVVDNGDVDAISAQIDDEVDAGRSGTPLPSTPIPMGVPSCALPPDTSTPAADSTLPGAIITTYQGLDKNSGEVRWSTTLPAQTFGSVSLDDGVLYEVWAISRWQADRADVAVCVVDARTGQIRPIDSLDKLPGRIVLFKRNSDPETWSIGMFLENEQLIAVPAAFDPEVTGPVITLDETFSNGWQWNEVYEDSIYISMLNGDLVKIPIPVE